MKKYLVTMREGGSKFSFMCNARLEKTAANKARRWYKNAELVSIEYLGFYLCKRFISVEGV